MFLIALFIGLFSSNLWANDIAKIKDGKPIYPKYTLNGQAVWTENEKNELINSSSLSVGTTYDMRLSSNNFIVVEKDFNKSQKSIQTDIGEAIKLTLVLNALLSLKDSITNQNILNEINVRIFYLQAKINELFEKYE